MRNRPDSRHRIAGLAPTPEDAPGPVAGGWVPETDPDDGWLHERTPAGNDTTPDEADEQSRSRDSGAAGGHRAYRQRRSGTRRWGRLVERWVPEPLRDSRIDPGRRGALLLTVVAAVAALVAAVGVWRDRPEPRPVQAVSLAQVTDASTAPGAPVSPGQSGATTSYPGLVVVGTSVKATGVSAPGPGPTADGPIVVSVTGAVRRPGLVRLPPGARVADAIDQAGGTTTAADLTGLNLAQKLADGSSVVVADRTGGSGGSGGSGSSVSGPNDTGSAGEGSAGGAATGGGGGGAAATGAKLNLNTADATALDALPGVGPVTAAAIVAWREKNGRFNSVEQLQEIQGIGPARFAALSQLVTV